MEKKGRFRRGDLVLIALLALSAAVLGVYLFLHRTPGKQVIVRVDGQESVAFPLDRDCEYTIEDGYGGENHLVIKDGIACIDDANCPDRICVMQGAVSAGGEAIICLPHGVVVEIADGE